MFFVEPIAVPDVFASGIARIERLSGPMVRVTFYANQVSLADGEEMRVVVARLVMDIHALICARPAVDMALAQIDGAVGDILVAAH